MTPTLNVPIAKPDRDLMPAAAPENADRVQVRKRRRAARETDRLHDIERTDEQKAPGVVDLADHEHLAAAGGLHGHGDDRLGHVLADALLQRPAELRNRMSGGMHLARERERHAAVRPDE